MRINYKEKAIKIIEESNLTPNELEVFDYIINGFYPTRTSDGIGQVLSTITDSVEENNILSEKEKSKCREVLSLLVNI